MTKGFSLVVCFRDARNTENEFSSHDINGKISAEIQFVVFSFRTSLNIFLDIYNIIFVSRDFEFDIIHNPSHSRNSSSMQRASWPTL